MRHNTESALLKGKSNLLYALYKQEVTYLVILDLHAIFDTVDYNVQLKRLHCDTVKLSLTAPRYTGAIPATYAGPGQLGSGLPRGKCAWVMQGVNKSLRVEPLLTFKHLLTVYIYIYIYHWYSIQEYIRHLWHQTQA